MHGTAVSAPQLQTKPQTSGPVSSSARPDPPASRTSCSCADQGELPACHRGQLCPSPNVHPAEAEPGPGLQLVRAGAFPPAPQSSHFLPAQGISVSGAAGSLEHTLGNLGEAKEETASPACSYIHLPHCSHLLPIDVSRRLECIQDSHSKTTSSPRTADVEAFLVFLPSLLTFSSS